MINDQTPYKTAEIIRDTWPGIFRPPVDKSLNTHYNTKGNSELAMDIQIYTVTGCFYCDKIKELMKRANLKYTPYLVGEDITMEQLKEKYPLAHGFPYTIIDGNPIGGLVPTTKYLIEKGIVSSDKK